MSETEEGYETEIYLGKAHFALRWDVGQKNKNDQERRGGAC